MKIVVDSNPSLDLGLRSEQEDESASIIQQMRYSIGQFERVDGQRAARLEALTEKCCKLESENQALQGAVERHKEEKQQQAIDYERKLSDKDKEISKLIDRRSLPTIREIPGNSAAMQNPRPSLEIGVKEKKTPRQKDNGVGEGRRTMLPKRQKTHTYISTPRDDAATSEMVKPLSVTSPPYVARFHQLHQSQARSSFPPPGCQSERSHISQTSGSDISLRLLPPIGNK